MTQNILIRSPNHLGDCIMALPMISEVREAYPGSTVTVLTPEPLAELFQQNPAIDKILKIPDKHVHGLIGVIKVKEIIAAGDFDVGYILPPSFGSASAFKLAGVKERIGYIADGRRLLLSRPLPMPAPLNSEHRSYTYFNLLRRATGLNLDYVRPKLFLNDKDMAQAATVLSDFGIMTSDRMIVVAFRAVAESRRWGIDNYTELTRRIINEFGRSVILTGGAADRSEGEKICEAVGSPKVVNLAGKTSLRESAALMSMADLFVGNDSGPAHLAAATGAPVIVLSGADDPSETSPMSARKQLLYRDKLECISCVKNRCPNKKDDSMKCMKEISVDDVISAVKVTLDSI